MLGSESDEDLDASLEIVRLQGEVSSLKELLAISEKHKQELSDRFTESQQERFCLTTVHKLHLQAQRRLTGSSTLALCQQSVDLRSESRSCVKLNDLASSFICAISEYSHAQEIMICSIALPQCLAFLPCISRYLIGQAQYYHLLQVLAD